MNMSSELSIPIKSFYFILIVVYTQFNAYLSAVCSVPMEGGLWCLVLFCRSVGKHEDLTYYQLFFVEAGNDAELGMGYDNAGIH